MFEQFTDGARRVVVLAQEQARLLEHSSIGPEHLLLGVVQEGEGVGARALGSVAVTLERARAAVVEVVGRGASPPSGHIPFTPGAKHIPFTPSAKKALEQSLREALQLGHNYIGTEHVVLGLIDERGDTVARVLELLGVDPDAVRASVLAVLGGEPATGRAQFIAMPPSVLSPGPVGAEVCSFCGRDLWEVDRYVAGSGAMICAECVTTAAARLADARSAGEGPLVHLPPRVFGDEPHPGAADAAAEALRRVFGSGDPGAQADWIEDGEALAALLVEAHRRHVGMGKVTVRVERVRFLTAEHVEARFALVLPGGWGPVVEGPLVVREGRWVVGRELIVRVLGMAGVPLPPEPS